MRIFMLEALHALSPAGTLKDVKIHHLNCGCMHPVGGKLLPSVFPPQIVCHCLLIETAQRLVLIDTGLGVRDNENPSRLGFMSPLLGVERGPSAVSELARLGFKPSDVTDLVPTHLDFDHAGGIEDFPAARVHISAAEYQAWSSASDIRLKQRYKTVHFTHEVNWRIYEESTDWNGFAAARELKDLPEELVCVKLPGHTPGHFGVAVHDSKGWTLHAGDSYYDHRELSKKPMQLGLSLFQKVAHYDYKTAMETQRKLRALTGVRVFCAHDPSEIPAPNAKL